MSKFPMTASSPESVRKAYFLCGDRRIILYTAGTALRIFLTTLLPWFSGRCIDCLICKGPFVLFFLILSGTAFSAWGLDLLLRGKIIRIARDRELQLQYRMLEVFQSLKPQAAECCRNGEIAMKFYRDTTAAEQFLAQVYPQFLNIVFGFSFALIFALVKSRTVALLFLCFFPVMLAGLRYYAGKLALSAHTVRSVYDRSINRIFEIMHIFPFLKSMAAYAPYFVSPKAKFRKYRKINGMNDRIVMKLEYFNRFLLLAGEYSVLGVSGWLAWHHDIRIGDVVMFQVLFLSLLNSFSGIFQILPGWKSAQEGFDSICELLENPETEDTGSNIPIPTALADISAKNIHFRYSGGTNPIFENFSCTIKAGSIVALTGVNGSGKTTLLKLLTGYLLPEKGWIEIAGKKLTEWQIRSFREKIACVFQDNLLITGTIRDNITLKNSRYSDSDIMEAVRLSGAEQIVSRMRDGLNHRIGQDGGGLSGGERQKIAIARALIRKPEILIFDEVTNHLDCNSRIRVRELLLSLRGKMTVFLVSHDPELVTLCDQEINLDSLERMKS